MTEDRNHELAEIKRVLAKIEDLPEKHDKLVETLTEFRIDVKSELAALKTKSGIWGLIGGTIPVLLALIWMVFRA